MARDERFDGCNVDGAGSRRKDLDGIEAEPLRFEARRRKIVPEDERPAANFGDETDGHARLDHVDSAGVKLFEMPDRSFIALQLERALQ